MTFAVAVVESEERKDEKPRVTVLQLISVPSVAVLLVASLFAAASLTFLDPLLGALFLHPRMPLMCVKRSVSVGCTTWNSCMRRACLERRAEARAWLICEQCCVCQVHICRRSLAGVSAWWGYALECVPSCTQSHPRLLGMQTQQLTSLSLLGWEAALPGYEHGCPIILCVKKGGC